MDDTTAPGGNLPRPRVTKEAEKEALLLAKKEVEAINYFTDNFPPKSQKDIDVIRDLARKRAEAQVEELKRLEPEMVMEKPTARIAKETTEKISKESAKEAAEEALRNKMVTEDLLKKFRLRSAAEKAIEGTGRVARGAAKMIGPIGNVVDLLSPSETVSEEEEMKELEAQKAKENFLATKKMLEKSRNPANKE